MWEKVLLESQLAVVIALVSFAMSGIALALAILK